MTTTDLRANRETDALVARALGWRDVRKPDINGAVDLVGVPPGAEKESPVPFYSSSTAAMLALEAWQAKSGREAEVVIQPAAGDHKFAAAVSESEWNHAPSLWLALCKLIVAESESDG